MNSVMDAGFHGFILYGCRNSVLFQGYLEKERKMQNHVPLEFGKRSEIVMQPTQLTDGSTNTRKGKPHKLLAQCQVSKQIIAQVISFATHPFSRRCSWYLHGCSYRLFHINILDISILLTHADMERILGGRQHVLCYTSRKDMVDPDIHSWCSSCPLLSASGWLWCCDNLCHGLAHFFFYSLSFFPFCLFPFHCRKGTKGCLDS